MIVLSTKISDQNGSIRLGRYRAEYPYANAARLARSATLDGGSVFVHSGVSTSDRQIEVACRVSEAESETLRNIFENHTLIKIATREGMFDGYLQSLEDANGEARITLYIKE